MTKKLIPLLLLAYTAMVIYGAAHNGIFKWGAFGIYSAVSYLLLAGTIAALLGMVKTWDRNIYGFFLVFFIAYAMGLNQLKPANLTVQTGGWLLSFMGFLTGGLVIAVGMVFARKI